MSKWILVVLLALQAHFAASYIVPLDKEGRRAFRVLLGWAWPWGYGDEGPLGQIAPRIGAPAAGFFLAAVTFLVFLLAALTVAGVWIPMGWWRALATAGAVLLVSLMALFLGPTKIIPIGLALATLYIALRDPNLFAAG